MDKIYITRWALSRGILEIPTSQTIVNDDNWISITQGSPLNDFYSFPPNDWYRSKEEAIARAIHLRDRKIASLEKQIARLKKLRF